MILLHDWSKTVTIETEWSTDVVTAAETLAEERRGLVGRPRRTVTVRWLALSGAQANRLLLLLMRTLDQATDVPIFPDVTLATATASGTSIPCDTTNRRFRAGGKVIILDLDGDGAPTNVQTGTINALTDSEITLTGALTGSYSAGAVVLPVLVCKAILEGSVEAMTDRVVSAEVTFEEKLSTALEGEADYADLTGMSFDTADDADGNTYYVFEASPDWRVTPKIRLARSGRAEVLGRDDVVFTRGPRPLLSFAFEVLNVTRDEWARLLAFFDAHRGRLIPFFLVNPVTVWRPYAVNTGYVEVEADDTLTEAQDFADYVAIETTDGSRHIRPISVVAEFSTPTRYRISVSSNFPALTLGEIERVTTAHLCRFEQDSLREEWHTNETCAAQIAVQEIVAEAAVGMDDPGYAEPGCEV